MQIRSFRPVDAEVLAKMYCDCFAEPPWQEKFLPDEVKREFRGFLNRPELVFLVVEEQGSVVGAAIGFDLVRKPDVRSLVPKSRRAGMYYLAEMFVQSDRRQRGIGTALITELLSRCAQEGYGSCVLRTSQELADGLYADQGFQPVAKQEVTSIKISGNQEVPEADVRIILVAANPFFTQ